METKEKTFSNAAEQMQEAFKSTADLYKKESELLSDSGTQFLNTLTKEDNLKNYSEQFKNLIGSAIKTSEQTINNLIETYNKEAQFTQKASEELLSSITKQFDAVAEMNTKLFNDSLKHL